ncbi:MAG: hypothetical protein PHZ23_15530 [Acidiphilium sp.]|nr:hypothetical protein [Acidiphilium sp.]
MSVRSEWNMACPDCGRDDELSVELKVFATIYEDGTAINDGDHIWDDDSACQCGSCGKKGVVSDFKLPVREEIER